MKRFLPILGFMALLLVAALLCPHGAVQTARAADHGGYLPMVPFLGIIINAGGLQALFKSFKVIFQDAFAGVTPLWQRIATLVPSSSKIQGYPWLGQLPSMREWIGDRVINGLKLHDYSIANKPFELTQAVGREDIEYDTFGIYSPLFSEMGRSSAAHPDELIFDLLAAGFTSTCFDGQYFFDTDHPVGDASVSNYQSGSGAAWYLLDVTRAIKPLIFQQNKKPEFTALDRPTDERVFMNKEFVYGIDCRDNAGFGLWQLAYASKADLTPDNYAAARAAMGSLTNDHGRPLGINPMLLVFPPSLEGKARKILVNDRNDAGAANEWAGTAEPLKVPWLA